MLKRHADNRRWWEILFAQMPWLYANAHRANGKPTVPIQDFMPSETKGRSRGPGGSEHIQHLKQRLQRIKEQRDGLKKKPNPQPTSNGR